MDVWVDRYAPRPHEGSQSLVARRFSNLKDVGPEDKRWSIRQPKRVRPPGGMPRDPRSDSSHILATSSLHLTTTTVVKGTVTLTSRTARAELK